MVVLSVVGLIIGYAFLAKQKPKTLLGAFWFQDIIEDYLINALTINTLSHNPPVRKTRAV